jgi:hypothetical protein
VKKPFHELFRKVHPEVIEPCVDAKEIDNRVVEENPASKAWIRTMVDGELDVLRASYGDDGKVIDLRELIDELQPGSNATARPPAIAVVRVAAVWPEVPDETLRLRMLCPLPRSEEEGRSITQLAMATAHTLFRRDGLKGKKVLITVPVEGSSP